MRDFKFTIEAKRENIADIIVAATDSGGTNYWASWRIHDELASDGMRSNLWPDTVRMSDAVPLATSERIAYSVLVLGKRILVIDSEVALSALVDEDDTPDRLGYLSRTGIRRAINILASGKGDLNADIRGRLINALVNDDADYDAADADCFVQLAVLGEVVYG